MDKPSQSPQRATLTIEEAAEVLRISKSLAYEAAHRGEIPAIRIGGRWVVPRVRLERLIDGEAAS
jgi:excisionase family DNA binding protein